MRVPGVLIGFDTDALREMIAAWGDEIALLLIRSTIFLRQDFRSFGSRCFPRCDVGA